MREALIFAMGNPLLDIQAEVSNDFLTKYNLDANNSILAEEKHKGMYDDMTSQYNVEYVPGGATQNTVRIAQWLIGVPRATTFVGCIGKDKYGEILEQKAKEGGVNALYMYNEKESTGTCAVLLTDKNRSLCAYLGAANHFKQDHLHKPEVWSCVEKSQIFYIAGFPLTVSPESMLELAKFSADHHRKFCMNLSAPFLCAVFKEQMMTIIPYVDILFGNESEAETFCKEHNWGVCSSQKDIAIKLASLPKHNGSKGRIVVLTQGSQATIVIRDGIVHEYPVIPIKMDDIVDTNGAGDAFVGGFLAELAQGRDFDECIRCANYAANLIIQRSGCTLPSLNKYTEHTVGF